MPSPNHTGWRTSGGSHGDDMESDGASVAGPQPSEGDKREFLRCLARATLSRTRRKTVSSEMSPVPSECGLEPKGVDRPNPMVGFPRLQARQEVNRSGDRFHLLAVVVSDRHVRHLRDVRDFLLRQVCVGKDRRGVDRRGSVPRR